MIRHCCPRDLGDGTLTGCGMYFDDEFRTTICPHDTFAVNDGRNAFQHHPESYLHHSLAPLQNERDRFKAMVDLRRRHLDGV